MVGRACTQEEQARGGRLGEGLDAVVGPHVEGRDAVDQFARNPQCLAAGGEHAQMRAIAQQVAGDFGTGSNQVFAVVDNEQQLARAEHLQQDVENALAAHLRDPEGLGDGAGDLARVGERGQLDQGDTVAECAAVDLLVGKVEGQAGLARSARAGDGHQRHFGQPVRQLVELVLATDKAVELARQVINVRLLGKLQSHAPLVVGARPRRDRLALVERGAASSNRARPVSLSSSAAARRRAVAGYGGRRAPRSRSEIPRGLSPARSASSCCDRPAASRNASNSDRNDSRAPAPTRARVPIR
jgi:hypothetical protein